MYPAGLFKCDKVHKNCRPAREGSRPTTSAPDKNHDEVIVASYTSNTPKEILDWEAFEGQWLADFPRAGRMTGFLIVGGLWEGGCYFGDSRSTVRKVRVRHEFL